MLLREALDSISDLNVSESARTVASSDGISSGCGDATPGERAWSRVVSLSVREDESSGSLQAGNRSGSGGQVARVISWAIDAAFKRGVLSLGVGIETS
jgi:hypothetical protein